jgi:PAS domain S-box-containing protein
MNPETNNSLYSLASHDEISSHEAVISYQQIVYGLSAPVYTIDSQGRITFYNKAAVELWGREPEAGQDLWCGAWKIYQSTGEPLSLDRCALAVSLKTGNVLNGEEIIVERPDGTKRIVIQHPQLFFDTTGKITGAINTMDDITEMKRVEEELHSIENKNRVISDSLDKMMNERSADLRNKNDELKKSEDRYHNMIDEIEDYAVLLLDASGIIQNWNKGAEKIKGYKDKEIIGSNFRIFYLPDDQENNLPEKLIEEAKVNGKALHEGWRVRKNGTHFWGSITITALHDNNNNVIGFSKVTRDLTERKMAEDKIKQYASDLEFQNKELEQFAYAAAHDMKEPLRKVQFYSNYIFDNIGNQLPEKEKDYLMRSIAASSRMQGLIDDLLTYAKASPVLKNSELVDLNSILAETVLMHQDLITEANAVIESDTLPVIRAISFQFNQLFENLIGNSLKYRHSKRPLHIRVIAEMLTGSSIKENNVDPQKKFYKISVIDNGIGFEKQYVEKIFDLFHRLHDRTQYAGTGIGLSICKKIVQNHQGYITATGEYDQGARFDIYIPV